MAPAFPATRACSLQSYNRKAVIEELVLKPAAGFNRIMYLFS